MAEADRVDAWRTEADRVDAWRMYDYLKLQHEKSIQQIKVLGKCFVFLFPVPRVVYSPVICLVVLLESMDTT
jgi:hypothetical protein